MFTSNICTPSYVLYYSITYYTIYFCYIHLIKSNIIQFSNIVFTLKVILF